MMKTGMMTRLIVVAVLSALSACSYVKSLFPDKEKDYQYTTEIPPMILPADLKADYVPGLPASAPPAAEANNPEPTAPAEQTASAAHLPESAVSAAPTANKPTATPSGAAKDEGFESEPEEPDEAVTVERVKFDNGENRLRINVPFIRAWRITGKALSRKFIEVTVRDQDAGLFTVQYEPDELAEQEPSYWDELTSIFSETHGNEKTYLIKLEKNSRQTDMVVVDKDLVPLSDAASFKLLTVLQETIKADLAHKAASANKSPKE